jgi:hypothetical protein
MRSRTLPLLAASLVGVIAAMLLALSTPLTLHAQGKSGAAPGHSDDPSPVGAWWGIARPCPADPSSDPTHVGLCQQICGACPFIPGTLPPEVPMMPNILGDGTVVVNDAGSIPVFHTTAQGQWAADPNGDVQLAGRARYQASFVWLQGSPDQVSGTNVIRQFVGVARPRFVTFFDPNNPDEMVGYIQPYFFPIVGAGGAVNVLSVAQAGAFEGNHFPALNFFQNLPAGCDPTKGCLGTYHFTINRIKPSVQ